MVTNSIGQPVTAETCEIHVSPLGGDTDVAAASTAWGRAVLWNIHFDL